MRERAGGLDQFVGPVLEGLIDRFEVDRNEMTKLERHIRELADTSRYADAHDELRKLLGVGLLTAMTFLTEMGDRTRFENRRQVAAYLALCPASFESGESYNRKGHITRQGPSRLRRMLCRAVWSSLSRDPEVSAAYERIKGGKPQRKKKAIVALTRSLGIKMWFEPLNYGVSPEIVGRGGPEHVRTSAHAQQRGHRPIVSPSPRLRAITR